MSSSEKLKLEVLLAAIDKATKPLKDIREGSSEMAKALKAARDRLKELNGEQSRLDAWRQTAKNIAVYKNMLAQAEERVKAAATAMKAGEFATREQQRAFKEARNEANELKMRLESLREKQQHLRNEFAAAGRDTKNLIGYQKELKQALGEATTAVEKQSKVYEERKKIMQRYGAARAAFEKSAAQRERLENSGARTVAVGATIGLPVAKAVKDYATFETAMLGVARQVNGARDDNGKLTATYHEMGDAIKEMSERIPMGTTEFAKIVEAGARMGIQGKKNLITYAELTATMAQAFDLPVDRLGEDMAKVAGLFKQPIDRIGEMGDAINYLDDNALAKGGDIIEVLKRIGGTAQMVNMNFKEAAALGSTFLSLGAMPEVAATASNAMIRELSIATMQTKRFKGGLEMLKLDAKALQFGMNKDATGTIIKVLDAIKALPQEKQLEAATRLFGKEFGDDAAKLAQNLSMYREQLALVNAERGKGSMQREGDARKDTIDSRLLMAKNAIFNLSSELGESLKPALVATLEKTLSIVQAVRAWAKENPGMASGLMTVVKYLALTVTIVGALMLAAAGILAPLAMAKLGLAALGITCGQASLGVWAVLKPVLLIIGAFYAGYKAGELLNEGINMMLSRLLGYKTTLGGALFDLVQVAATLPGRFMATGGQIIDGLIDGIKGRWTALKSLVTGLADSTVGWLKDKLGIHSPSRVFAELGGFTMDGFEQGILGGLDGPLGALQKMAKQLTAAGAGVLIGGSAMAMPTLDTRAPLSPASMMSAAAGPMIVQITINAAPGMNEQAIARQVAVELQRIEAQRAARGRSRLRDAE